MALFTDGTMAGVQDLADHDTGVLDVAKNEAIDLTRKLALAQEEIGVDLMAMLRETCAPDWQFALPGAPGPGNVVVTAPLRLWHTFHTLALVYRDAFHNQLNDRYEGKWKEYVELARWAAEKLRETGVGISDSPVPRANPPELSVAPGNLAEGTYYVTASWLNSSEEEGACAAPQAIAVPAGMTFEARAMPPGANARTWNVYAGVSADALTLQNQTPLSAGATWMQTFPVHGTGPRPGEGQQPLFLRTLPRILQRG